jgi:hypothetical protein
VKFGIKSGMTVADIGAGSGYHVVRLSPIVGPRGRIIAEDVVPEYLQSLRSRVRGLGLQNVVINLGEPHDPRLPADSLDVAILVHMYHEIAQRCSAPMEDFDLLLSRFEHRSFVCSSQLPLRDRQCRHAALCPPTRPAPTSA